MYKIERTQCCLIKGTWFTENKEEIYNFFENEGYDMLRDYTDIMQVDDNGEVINYDDVASIAFTDFLKSEYGTVGDWHWTKCDDDDIIFNFSKED